MSEDKLNSWKEIATYLKCDESTARRWERRNRLPIHRVGKGGSVYAYAQEIDEWLKSQSAALTSERQSADSAARVGLMAANSSTEPSATTVVPAPDTIVTPSPDVRSTERFFSRWKFPLITAPVFVLVILTTAFLYTSKRHRAAQLISAANSMQQEAIVSDMPVSEAVVTQLKEHVKSAQIWEMLTLYAAPWNCDARDVERYWERGSKAYNDVLESASRLNERGWHYGFGARLLNFEFRYVRLARDGLSAEIGTREHWWLPLYTYDESPVTTRNPDQGPFEIDYLFVKIDSKWYLRSENTPYPQWKPKQITCANWFRR